MKMAIQLGDAANARNAKCSLMINEMFCPKYEMVDGHWLR
jgi:hypothetical protein